MGWRFPGIGPPLPFWPLMVGHRTPWHWWACHSAYANILQWEFNEAQVYWKSTPLLSWTWLVLTSFCHVIWLHYLGFPTCFSDKESTCQCRRHEFSLWVSKIPHRRIWQPTLVFLLGKSHGQRSLVGYSPWGCKESDTTDWLNNNAYVILLKVVSAPFPCVSLSLSWPWVQSLVTELRSHKLRDGAKIIK